MNAPTTDPGISTRRLIDLTVRNNSHTLLHELAIATGKPGLSILEVGCSSGYPRRLAGREGHRVTGIEPDPVSAEAAARVLHEVWRGGLDEYLATHPDVRFDVLVFGDVLEHMVDPAERCAARSRTCNRAAASSSPCRTSRTAASAPCSWKAASTTKTVASWIARTCASSPAPASRACSPTQALPSNACTKSARRSTLSDASATCTSRARGSPPSNSSTTMTPATRSSTSRLHALPRCRATSWSPQTTPSPASPRPRGRMSPASLRGSRRCRCRCFALCSGA